MATYKRVRGRFFWDPVFPLFEGWYPGFPLFKGRKPRFPLFKGRDPGFPLFEGRDSELKVCTGCWMPKITLRG